jgi:hypothetical protein
VPCVRVVVFFAAPPAARLLGHDVFAVRSGSMAPALGVGALVAVIVVGVVVGTEMREGPGVARDAPTRFLETGEP